MATMNAPSPKYRRWFALAAFLLITFSAPALSAIIEMPGAWYAGLKKPALNPPSWVFGPVWTLLYTLMAVAAWLVWQRRGFRRPLLLYFIQLTLNAVWTPVFFGMHALGPALVVIVLMWVVIVLTLLSFKRVNNAAGWLLVPYLGWVTFATYLNWSLWRLNG